MSTYYYLLNDTKKLRIHHDNHVKRMPIMLNPVVQHMLINYMFENLGDSFRFVSDDCDEYLNYKELDISNKSGESRVERVKQEKTA